MRFARFAVPLAAVLLLTSGSTAGAGTPDGPGVTVPVPAAPIASPPPGVRACAVRFDGFSEVATDCPRPCYSERWDGPLLHASNACERSIWVTHVFMASDGRTYRTPCFELAAGVTLTIPEAALASASQREAHVGITPGPGWPVTGFRLDCYPARTPLTSPIWWLGERWDATVHEGTLGPDADRPEQGSRR